MIQYFNAVTIQLCALYTQTMDDTFVAQLHRIFVVDLAEISSSTATTTPDKATLIKTSLTEYADLATKESTTDIRYTIASKSR